MKLSQNLVYIVNIQKMKKYAAVQYNIEKALWNEQFNDEKKVKNESQLNVYDHNYKADI